MKKNIISYKKPAIICQENKRWGSYTDQPKFIFDYKTMIEEYLNSNGFKLRTGTNNDIQSLDEHSRSCYAVYGEEAVNSVSSYDIYRFIKFGNSLVLEDHQNVLTGCIFEVGYDTPDKCSYVMRLAIKPNMTNKNLGYLLWEYCCLLAMERGSYVMRGLMKTDTISLSNIALNKMGWICDGFENGERYGVGDGLNISMPLNIEGFTSNRIDSGKLLDFIKNNTKDKDYILIDYTDTEKMKKIHDKNDFWIVAVVRKGHISDIDQYFALPVEKLHLR
jgi:hypothetical protein